MITYDDAARDITDAREMIEGLLTQLNVIYYDQIQGNRVMSKEEKHTELVNMLPALKGTVNSCFYLVDRVFDYINDDVAREKRS